MTDINSAAASQMSKSEREDLQRLVRQRERVLTSAAKQRSTELAADFENQMGQQYSFDQDEVWTEAVRLAEVEVGKANARIAERCAQLGIPQRFAPFLKNHWFDRGENMLKERRSELRQMAQTRIAAIERKAITEIQISCLAAQERIALAGLCSEAAREFIDQLPSIEALMPKLAFAQIADEAEPPVAEQLISPNALRQRRYRERHRNAAVTHESNADDDGGAP